MYGNRSRRRVTTIPVPVSPINVRKGSGIDGWRTVRVVAHRLGYARVSTADQNPALQHDALTAAGCWKTWTDTASGRADDRPELAACLAALRPGDTLVVWRLDRLGRSLRHLIDTMTDLDTREVRIPVPDRSDRHDHRRRPAGLPPLRGARRF